jgi:hypothetical protein
MRENKSLKELSKLVEELEKQRESVVVPILMDQTRSISRYLVSLIYEKLDEKLSAQGSPKNIDIIIHSSGGDADAAYHLAVILQEYCKSNLTAIVPRYAKSAATLLACGADKICMNSPSELGPIDPQIEDSSGMWVSASSISTTIELLKGIESGPLLREFAGRIPVMGLGDIERMRDHIEDILTELLLSRMFKEKEDEARDIARRLTKEYKFHGKAITFREAKKIGLKVEKLPEEQWKLVWKIYKIFEEEVLVG